MRRYLKRGRLQEQKDNQAFSWPKRGQVMVEYTVVFALIAVVTAIATAAFFSRICRSEDGNSSAFERYYNAIEQRIIK